ncbi:MAG: isochorismatase family protein [Sphingobium sp.]
MPGFVIVVDMQRDFVAADGALPVPDAEAIVAPMQAWLAALDPAAVAGVLMTFDTHVPHIYAGSLEATEFPIHCEQGTPGWESVLDAGVIDPTIPVYRLTKGVFDMWAEPDLNVQPYDGGEGIDRDGFFDGLKAQGVGAVTVVGVAADYCVRWAVQGLVARGFSVTMPTALTRGIAMDAPAVIAELAMRGDVTAENQPATGAKLSA